jgi:hypothetical protein
MGKTQDPINLDPTLPCLCSLDFLNDFNVVIAKFNFTGIHSVIE